MHEHTLKCFANPTANLENPEIWERPFQTMELTGNWSEDVISIAQTQLGYTESSANYIVDEFDDTRIHGYTRYGAWYGYPYSEWCAMFCSFVYHYAEVDSNVFPCSYHICTNWVDALTRAQLWHSGDNYIPQPGDLIFFDTEKHDGLADHVGLVYNWNPDTGLLTTIEGNRIVAVDKFDYYLTDDTILGFGELPENPELAVKAQEELPAPTEAPVEEAELACTCAAEEGQPHAEDCPLYMPECTCGAAEEEAHAEDCPVAIWQAKKAAEAAALAAEAEPTCTCGAEEGQPHAEDCPVAIWQAKKAAEAAALAAEAEPACTCGAEEGQPHAKDCPLYVPVPVEIRSAPASDGAVAVVNGVLPEGAEVTIEAVTFTENQLIAYFGAKRAAAMKNYVAYDIKIMVNGEEWQPDESVSVVVEHPAIEVAQGESFGVAHIDGVTDEVSTVKAEVSVEGDVSFTADAVVEAAPAPAAAEAALPEATLAPVEEVSFEAEGFSVYFFYTFTVDFHFGDITFCMEGRSEMLLSELFAELGILSNAADVYSVTFSAPSLVEVQQVEGDWLLISLEPFETEESLYIQFNDGTVLIIEVTDAVGGTDVTYWLPATEIKEKRTYLIVSPDGTYALGSYDKGTAKVSATNFETSVVGGKTYYKTSLGSEFRWTLSGTQSSGSLWNEYKTNAGIAMKGDYIVSTDNTNIKNNSFTYNSNDDTWTVLRTDRTYYLSYSNNAFSRNSNTSKVKIYELTDAPAEENPSSDGVTYWLPATEIRKDDVILIVSPDNAKALGNNNGSAKVSTGSEVFFGTYTTDVEGTDVTYYKTNLGSEFQWTMQQGSSSGWYAMNNGAGLTLRGGTNAIVTNTTGGTGYSENQFSFSQNTDLWTVSRKYNSDTYRLTYSNSTFSRVTNGSSSGVKIYKQVKVEPEEPGEGGVSWLYPKDGEAKPDYYKHIDAFRDEEDNPDTTLDTEASDLTDLYRLYLDVGPESTLNAVDLLLIIDRSTSMKNTYDATDIKGATKQKRQLAMNSLLNGQVTAGEDNTSTLYANGLISKYFELNPNNKIAITSFCGDGFDVYGWTDTPQVAAGETYWGTNYVYGLANGKRLLQDASIKNDGREKIIIFLSDGTPTCYSKDIDNVSPGTVYTSIYDSYTSTKEDKHYTGYQEGNDSDQDKYTKAAITSFKNWVNYTFTDAQGKNWAKIYTIGIGKFDNKYLNSLSSSGTTLSSSDFQQILNEIDNLITRGAGRYSNLKVTDKLSKYVDFYAAQPDFLIEKVPDPHSSDPNAKKVTLYQNGDLTDAGKKIIKQNGVKLDYENKMVTVDFRDDYYEEAEIIYRISFNVKTTQDAYDEFAQNKTDPTNTADGYLGVKGDNGTDIYENITSSNQPGFHSNEYASLEYTQTHAGESGKTYRIPYDHPVIQVATTKMDIEKVWADGNQNHTEDSVTVKLYYTQKEQKELYGTATLDKNNGWKYSFTDLPIGYEYTVGEIDVKPGYLASYSYSEDKEKCTITNAPAAADITLIKVDSLMNAIPIEGVTFELYKDNAGEIGDIITYEKDGETCDKYYTDGSGKITFEDLSIGESYWLKEITAPGGYNLLTAPHKFTVSSETLVEKLTGDEVIIVDADKLKKFEDAETHMIPQLAVINSSGYELPKTGGTGTALYYISGSLLAGFALIYGCIAYTKKREGRHAKT